MKLLTLFINFILVYGAHAVPQNSPVPSSKITETSHTAPSATPVSSLSNEEQDKLFTLHEDLVNIPSISNDETKCADFISEYLEELGYHVEKVPMGNTSTYNVFAYPKKLHEQGQWPEVLITSHIDTVKIPI